MNPATVTQQAMSEAEKETMFKTWEANTPQDPKRGWYSSLYTEYNKEGEYCIKSMIEDYNDDGCIELIGLAELTIDWLTYTEKYNDAPPSPSIIHNYKAEENTLYLKKRNEEHWRPSLHLNGKYTDEYTLIYFEDIVDNVVNNENITEITVYFQNQYHRHISITKDSEYVYVLLYGESKPMYGGQGNRYKLKWLKKLDDKISEHQRTLFNRDSEMDKMFRYIKQKWGVKLNRNNISPFNSKLSSYVEIRVSYKQPLKIKALD